MQLYHSEIIASLFDFCYFSSPPSHQCHFASDLRLPFIAKLSNEGKIKDGSFVLIDVESRSFICFNLRIFYKLLLRVRITFHYSVNQSHTHSFTFIELQLEFVATLQQSIEFLRVQLCGRKSKYVKTSIFVSIAVRFNSQLGRRVASFRLPVIADFECFL